MNPWSPILASQHAADVDRFNLIVHAVMAVAFAFWVCWFFYCLIRFRRHKAPNADYRGHRFGVPFWFAGMMALIEAVLVAGWSLPFWERQVMALDHPPADPVEIGVVAQQFQWQIHYPGLDGAFGRTDIARIDPQLNPIGLDRDDPAAKDDFVLANQLRLPVDQPVVVYLSTMDMIHSFFLPELRVKQDAIPGMRIPVSFTPTMTTAEFRERTGNPLRDFQIACAQLCGLNHYTMVGRLIIQTSEEYDAWVNRKVEEELSYGEEEAWPFQE